MKSIGTILLVAITSTVSGQTIGVQDNLKRTAIEGSVSVQTFDNRYEGIKGSPYVFEDFLKGTVTINKVVYDELYLNIDAYNNIVLFKRNPSDQEKAFNNSKIEKFTVERENGTVKQFELILNETREYTICEILFSGKSKHYKTYSKTIIKADYQGAYSSNKRYDEFDEIVRYFVDGVLYKNNLKGITGVYPTYAAEIKKFVKDNNLKLNLDGDLIKLLAFIDTLK